VNELPDRGFGSGEPPASAGREVRQAPDREKLSAGAADSGGAVPRQGPAEPLTRGEYADLMRRGPPARTGHAAAEAGRTAEGNFEAAPGNGAARRGMAEPRTREEADEQARSGTGPVTRAAAAEQPAAAGPGPGKITHYAAEFKGQRIDLVTDGTHWADTSDPATTRETTPVHPAGPAGHETGSQRKPEETAGPAAYLEDRSLKVTNNADDGIWIEGLPGEPPRQVGDLLVNPEDDQRTRADRLFAKAVDNAEDLFDAIEKNASLGFEALQRPPVHAEAAVPASHHAPETPSPLDAGNLATAALALGYLTWAAGRQIHQRMRDSSP
jgi:hypothetical protein